MRRIWTVGCLLLVAAEPPQGTPVTLDGLTATTPSSWQKEVARGWLYRFRIARSGRDKEDAELTISRIASSPASDQLAKLKELFLLPTNLPRDQALREWTIKNDKAILSCLDIQGTYHPKKTSVDSSVREVRPDYRLLAAVLVSSEGSYLIRLQGPKRTVSAHADEFEQWLRRFK
jgi:hypothetical protein